MEFTICLTQKGDACDIIEPSQFMLGVEDVKIIRKKAGYDLPLKYISRDYYMLNDDLAPIIISCEGHITKTKVYIYITVPEEIAFKLEAFAKTSTLNIEIEGYLDKYLIKTTILKRYIRVDVIYEAGITIKLDKSQILSDWIAAGCPKQWKIKEA